MRLNSAIYNGTIRHRRFDDPTYSFEYSLFMMYLDLSELEEVFEGVPGWSTNGWAPAWFRSEDHGADDRDSLEQRVRGAVERRTGHRPDGPIRLLTHLRYFGYCFNPVSFYYCFDGSGELEAIVPEVSNTPWRDMHRYILPRSEANRTNAGMEIYFDKDFFVSPFMPEDVGYRFVASEPNESHRVHMDSYRDGERFFDATLKLERETISSGTLIRRLIRTPAMTLKVIVAIYYEALKIWLKGGTYHSHPTNGQLNQRGDSQ